MGFPESRALWGSEEVLRMICEVGVRVLCMHSGSNPTRQLCFCGGCSNGVPLSTQHKF